VDPRLYDLESHGITPVVKDHVVNLNQMVPAILNHEAQSTLLDVPDALIALQKWPGQIKVIGPVTGLQTMAAAFPKDSPELRAAFNDYLREKILDGTYMRLVETYYPAAIYYFESYFAELQETVRLQTPAALQAGASTEQPG
jgi:ABC-type amino acid transport substrate-binding protein